MSLEDTHSEYKSHHQVQAWTTDITGRMLLLIQSGSPASGAGVEEFGVHC